MGHLRPRGDDTLGGKGSVSVKRGYKKPCDGGVEGVRAELRARYRLIFGGPAEEAPWGTPWSQVFEEAKAADEAYNRAEQGLAQIRSALAAARDLARAFGDPDEAPTIDDCVGMTAPECSLYAGFFLDDAPLATGLDYVTRAADLLRSSPIEATLQSPGGAEGFGHGAVAALMNPQEVGLALRRHLEATYRRGATRRLQAWDVDRSATTPLAQRQFASAVGGVPPRSPGSTEWRRATLVALLDMWPVHHAETGVLRLLSDTEIAVVSLLNGSLDELARVAPKKLVEGVALRDETKAIKHSRKRRTMTTNLLHSERWKPVVAMVEDAEQRLSPAKPLTAERAAASQGVYAPASSPSSLPPKTKSRRSRR